MVNKKVQAARITTESVPVPARKRAWAWIKRAWQPAGTLVTVALAAYIMGHVINGKHGLSVWQQNRAEDRELQKEILDMQLENAQLRQQIERLKSDPDAIERKAREEMHYAKPGEVIYTFPPAPPATQPQPAPAGK
jgi:cell division protein FtsB